MDTKRLRWGWLVVAALLLTACLPEGVRLPQNELLAALEIKSGLIAYIGDDGNLYLTDQAGGNTKQITTDALFGNSGYRIYTIPTWAPDGKTLAFSMLEADASQNPTKNRLYLVNKDGSGLAEAYNGDQDYVVFYSWSPDSSQIGLLAQTPRTLALKLIPAAGGETQTLDTGSPFYWSWAPDSRSVFIHAGSQNGRLALLELGDTVVEQGLDVTPTTFKTPAISPDGERVLFAGFTEAGNSALMLADRNGGNPQSLQEYQNEIAFTWSPDGGRIAYLNGEMISGLAPAILGSLTVLDPSGDREPLTLEEQVYAFFWSPDSRSLAYFAIDEVEDTNGETSRISRLKILDVGSGRSRVITPVAPTERFIQLIPYFDQYHHSLTIWSPDSQNLVVSTYYDEDQAGIFVFNASGNLEPRHIADGQLGIWSWK